MLRRTFLSGVVAATLISLGLGQQVLAGPIMGSDSLAGVITNTTPGGIHGDITTATSVTFSKFFETGSSGDWATYYQHADITGPFTITLNGSTPSANSFTISAPTWGTFTASSETSDILGVNSRTVYFDGHFTPGSDFPPTITTNTASLIIDFTQSGGAGSAISDSVSLNAPTTIPASVPEPTGFALMGLGGLLALVGYRRVRRSNQC